jgi:hypothetical protein
MVTWIVCQELADQGNGKYKAIIHDDVLDPLLVGLLGHAYELGALSSVKLIVVEELQFHMFLETAVSSSSFPIVEALWKQVVQQDLYQSFSLAFSSVTEVLTHRPFRLPLLCLREADPGVDD